MASLYATKPVFPLLGIVSLLPNEARQKQERTSLIRFLFAGAALVVTYAAGIAVLTFLSHTRCLRIINEPY